MSRIEKTLEQLRQTSKKMLSPYITAGYPSKKDTLTLMHLLVDSGADIIELGVPFSDPMAEGVVIQEAMERSLAQGVTLKWVLEQVAIFREKNLHTPIILMGYLNSFEHYGYDKIAHDMAASGVDGVIIVDLPPEESLDVYRVFKQHGLSIIFLCSPTTTSERMKKINAFASGYLYYVSLKGVTGSLHQDLTEVKNDYLAKKAQTTLPLMIGFGIKNSEMAAKMSGFADGIIVGAALILAIGQDEANLDNTFSSSRRLIMGMRQAIDDMSK